jgi:hypothetical protein
MTARTSSGSGSYRYSFTIASMGFLYIPFAISALSKARSIMTTFLAASMTSLLSGGLKVRRSSIFSGDCQ